MYRGKRNRLQSARCPAKEAKKSKPTVKILSKECQKIHFLDNGRKSKNKASFKSAYLKR